MQIRKFSMPQLLIKIVVFILLFYVAILAISVLITGYLFISLDSYKLRIEKVVFKHTGYKLHVNSIQTKLNSYYLPEIMINNATLTNPLDPKQNFSVKSLEFVFSYSSIWNLEPIFDQINIDSTDINLVYLKDGSIIFNGININHPDKKTIENTKNSPIDLENWILKQKSIKLTNINFSFDDKRNNLPVVYLNNITTTLTSGYGKKHNFMISLNTSGEKGSNILAKLNWVGGKVTDYDKWKSAEFKLQSYTGKNNIAGSLRRYLPEISLLNEFNAETALDAEIEDGRLQHFYANFDLKNLQYTIRQNESILSLPQLGGSIKIDLVNNSLYKLDATNLTISTPNGYILNNKNISGQYVVNKSGQVKLESTDLKAFNNILPLIPDAKGISFSGVVEIIKLDWLGKILRPDSFNIFAKFHDIAITSKNPNIPTIDGINGDISVSNDHGKVNLLLKNSTLLYKNVFLIPYKFKHLDTQINWQTKVQPKALKIESGIVANPESATLIVKIGKTHVQTADFLATLSGEYDYIPGTAGYLALMAHVDKVLTAKVGDYLPVQIGMPVHEWLNDGLIGGYGTNATLDLSGPLDDFPFQDNGGRFYIDANIQDAKLLYVKDWPTLDNIYGKFKIRNQKIIIEASSGKVYGNDINKALVTIPDMTANHVDLVADGLASGSTGNFMAYLQKTPINAIIGHIPDKLKTNGDGKVTLHLKVPFDNPEKTTVDGNYDFNMNTLKFDLPIPVLNSVNGKLYFNEKGVKIDKLSANTFDSEANLTANTDKNGMHFVINSPNLNYDELSKFYIGFLSSVITGRADTEIKFNIGSHGISDITAKSHLEGVAITAPKPLNKESQSFSSMNFVMTNTNPGFNINFDYAKLLNGKIVLNEEGRLKSTNLAIGTDQYLLNTSNNPKIIINAKLQNTYVFDWISQVTKLTSSPNKVNESETFGKTESNIAESSTTTSAKTDIYPLEVWLNTPHLYVGNTDYRKSDIDILVSQQNAIFAINNPQTDGYGVFDFNKNQLDVRINDFHYYQSVKNLLVKESSESELPFAVVINNMSAANPNLKNMSIARQDFTNMKSQNESGEENVKLPLTKINIDKFWFENQLLGKFMTTLRPSGKDLIIESSVLQGRISKVSFSGVNYCMECGNSKSFVDMQTTWDINDLGVLLDNIGHKDTIAGGKGVVTASVQWNGRLQDFDITHTIATIDIDIRDGKFLKIDTTSGVLAQLIGIMNLQYLYSFVNLSFGQVVENGFFFNRLNLHSYLINSKIDIKSLDIWGATAAIDASGLIDLQNSTINLRMSVTPHLSTSVAVGVGVATLNPVIGLITYGAELLLDSPINKLFTFTFLISGPLSKPTIQQIGVSNQVVKNVNSTIGQ